MRVWNWPDSDPAGSESAEEFPLPERACILRTPPVTGQWPDPNRAGAFALERVWSFVLKPNQGGPVVRPGLRFPLENSVHGPGKNGRCVLPGTNRAGPSTRRRCLPCTGPAERPEDLQRPSPPCPEEPQREGFHAEDRSYPSEFRPFKAGGIAETRLSAALPRADESCPDGAALWRVGGAAVHPAVRRPGARAAGLNRRVRAPWGLTQSVVEASSLSPHLRGCVRSNSQAG
jgi:hypothetical protein